MSLNRSLMNLFLLVSLMNPTKHTSSCPVSSVSEINFLLISYFLFFKIQIVLASLIACQLRICLQSRKAQFNSCVGKIPWRRDRLLIPIFLVFPFVSAVKESACNAGDLGLTPVLVRSPGEGKGYPLQYFGLENSMDCIVHGITKCWTRLSDFHFTAKKSSFTSQFNVLFFLSTTKVSPQLGWL